MEKVQSSATWDLDEVVRIGLWVLKEDLNMRDLLIYCQLPENPDERTNSGSGTLYFGKKLTV